MPIAVSGFESLVNDLLVVYEEAEEKMLGRMASRLSKGTASDRWVDRKYSEARAVSNELRRTIRGLGTKRSVLASEAVRSAWSESSKAFVADASKFTDILGITALSPNSPKVLSILSELNGLLEVEDRVILRKCNDAYADIIGRCSAKVATGAFTYRDAVKEELEDFARRGISGFVDKAGRAWDMASYAEMATLTAIERATRYGYVDTMQEYGYDLAIISSHAGACPLCVAWENVVVSVSGSTSGYPSLEEAENDGCFHPRCLHFLETYYEGITRQGRNAPRAVEQPSNQYSSRQHQRYYERKIREWKRVMAVAQTPADERAAYAHVRQYQQKVRDHIKETKTTDDKLSRKYYREGGRQKLTPEAKRLKPVLLSR